MDTPILIIILVLGCALLGATGQILFKLSSDNFSFNPLSWFKNIYFLLGITLYGLSAVLFVWSLKYGDVSLLYPIIATSYIWVTIFATLILNEEFPGIKWIGIILIITGIYVITK